MTISIGYCSAETSAFSRSLRRTCRRGQWGDIVGMIVAVPRLTPSELEALGLYHPGEPDAAQRLELLEYLVDVVRQTRTHESVLLGAGPRATQAVTLASRALAIYEGRDFVSPDDIRTMALPVLEHRMVLRPEAEVEGVQVAEVITEIVRQTPVPK